MNAMDNDERCGDLNQALLAIERSNSHANETIPTLPFGIQFVEPEEEVIEHCAAWAKFRWPNVTMNL